MAEITRYKAEDRRSVEGLYRRVFGNDAAEGSRMRWEWQYRRNPNNAGQEPEIWIAREGTSIVGQYATMPVRLWVRGQEVRGSWGMDVMVAPERQRQGLGEVLFRTWDRNVGASLGLGLSDSSYRLFQKLRWPDVGPVPCLVKPLTRRALRRPNWPVPVNRLVSARDAADRQDRGEDAARCAPKCGWCSASTTASRRCGTSWRRSSRSRCGATRAYLNWKYVSAPHVRYSIAVLRRSDRNIGYAVYRHLHEPRGRVTLLADFLADPDDETALRRCCSGSIARRGRPTPTRSARSPRTPAFRKRAPAFRLLPGEIDDGVRREGQCRRRGARLLRGHRHVARHGRGFGPGSMTREAGRSPA